MISGRPENGGDRMGANLFDLHLVTRLLDFANVVEVLLNHCAAPRSYCFLLRCGECCCQFACYGRREIVRHPRRHC